MSEEKGEKGGKDSTRSKLCNNFINNNNFDRDPLVDRLRMMQGDLVLELGHLRATTEIKR